MNDQHSQTDDARLDWQTEARAFLDREALTSYLAWRDGLTSPQKERHQRSLTQSVKNPPRWPGPDEGLRLMIEALGRNDEEGFKALRYQRVVHDVKEWV